MARTYRRPRHGLARPFLARAPALLLVLGVALSATLSFFISRFNERAAREQFEQSAANRVSSLRRTVELVTTDLFALRAFFQASEGVDRDEFHVFVHQLWMGEHDTQALEWAPQVLDADRQAFETATQNSGFAHFQITEHREGLVRAGHRPDYYPVDYVEPHEGNEAAFGFDLASSTERREALLRARDTGLMVATSRVRLVQEKGQQYGVLLFLAARSRFAAAGEARGVVLGVYRVGDMLERAFGYLAPEPVDVALFDDSAPEDERFLAFYSSASRSVLGSAPAKHAGGLEYTSSLPFADRSWRVVCTPAASFIAVRSFQPWLVFTLGLLVSVLLAAYIFSQEQMVKDATEREALSEQLELIRLNASDMLFLAAPDGRILEANARAQRAYGYAGDEILGLTVRDLRAPEARKSVEADLQQVFDGNGFRYTTTHRRRDGSTFPVEAIAHPLVMGANKLILAVIRDLTEERAARAAIDYQAMLLDNLHEAVIGTDAAFAITVWNRAAESIYGWPRQEAVGRTLIEVVSPMPVDGSSVEEVGIEVARKGQVRLEARHRTRDGKWIDVETTIVGVRGQDGGMVGRVAVVRDISERKRMESALRASEEQLKQILETCREGIWVADAQGRTEFANARAAELFAVPLEAMVGRPLTEVLPEPLRSALAADLTRFGRGESVKRELRWKGPGIVESCVMLSSSALRRADGSLAGTVGVFMDVTEYRHAQQELLQAQKLEAVGRLAAGIAHEMNTPIQFIGDNTHFLGEAVATLTKAVEGSLGPADTGSTAAPGGEEEELRYVIEQAPKTIARTLEGVRRIATLVRAMKEFAHPDQKEMVATDLNRSLLATLEVARNEYKYVAEVETDLASIPLVRCNSGELNQVFLNILINAAQAIEDAVKGSQKRGTIRVVTREEGPEVVVAISDTGIGIPDAVREKIFDPFFTTKDVGRGTGQGLAIAQNIVAKHHGHLTFTSQVGRGTTFEVRLPVDPAPTKAQAQTMRA